MEHAAEDETLDIVGEEYNGRGLNIMGEGGPTGQP